MCGRSQCSVASTTRIGEPRSIGGRAKRPGQVPRRALTLTIPALMASAQLFCVVPGPSKRTAIHQTLTGPIATGCPASILRQHPDSTLYTDLDGFPDAVDAR